MMFSPLPGISSIISLLALAFWIWMLYECLVYEPAEGNNKIIWLLVIIFTNIIGALLYYFIRRPERIRIVGR